MDIRTDGMTKVNLSKKIQRLNYDLEKIESKRSCNHDQLTIKLEALQSLVETKIIEWTKQMESRVESDSWRNFAFNGHNQGTGEASASLTRLELSFQDWNPVVKVNHESPRSGTLSKRTHSRRNN